MTPPATTRVATTRPASARAGAATLALGNTHPALRRCWHPVARSAEVTDRPARTMLLGEPWVLVRIGPGGEVRAFLDRCPHRQAPLSLGCCAPSAPSAPAAPGAPSAGPPRPTAAPAAGPPGLHLQCAYHGWRFDEAGRCVEIPALGPRATIPPKARLTAAHGVAERHGMVFLAPDAPLAPLGAVPEADDPAFMAGDLPVLGARASAGYLADNFLDMAHFPYVHAATFGAQDPVVPPFSVERRGWSYTAVNEHEFLHREDPGVAAGLRPLVQRRRVTYRVDAPFHLVLRLDFLDAGGTNVIGFFLQPQSEDRCRIYSTIWRDDLGHDAARMARAVAFEIAVIEEDLALQEAYDVHALPLDATAEVHTRADRSTLELRRMLADLVAAATAPAGPARQPTPDAPAGGAPPPGPPAPAAAAPVTHG